MAEAESFDHPSSGKQDGARAAMAALATLGTRPWVRRARLLLAVALLWAGLHYLVTAWLLPTGLNRPVLIAAARSPGLAALVVALLIWIGTFVGARLAGPVYRGRGLLVASLALAAWAIGGGTMDDWLILSAPGGTVGPPTATPYLTLILEYLFLLVAMLGAAVADGLATRPAASAGTSSGRLKQVLGLDDQHPVSRQGVLALLVTALVIGVLMLVLTGPAEGHTRRGQVYFAVVVATAAGVFLATRLTDAREPIWFWPAPLLVGLVGAIGAAVNPGLLIPEAYNQLNSIPAWGLVRPLPVEMVGVGTAAAVWTMRAGRRRSSAEPA